MLRAGGSCSAWDYAATITLAVNGWTPHRHASPKPGPDTITRLEQQLEKARARLHKVKRLNREDLRRKQTRQKIVLAGALIAQARSDDDLKALIDRLTREVPRAQDKAVFEGVMVQDLLAIPDDVDGVTVRSTRNLKNQKAEADGE